MAWRCASDEELLGDLRGRVELARERVARRERRRAARLFVGEARGLRGAAHLLEARARLGAAAARVLVAHARARSRGPRSPRRRRRPPSRAPPCRARRRARRGGSTLRRGAARARTASACPRRTRATFPPSTRRRRATLQPWLIGLKTADYLVTWRRRPIKEIDTAFVNACCKAGLPGGEAPYSVRHMIGRSMRRYGVPLQEIAVWLGHLQPPQNPKITLISRPEIRSTS